MHDRSSPVQLFLYHNLLFVVHAMHFWGHRIEVRFRLLITMTILNISLISFISYVYLKFICPFIELHQYIFCLFGIYFWVNSKLFCNNKVCCYTKLACSLCILGHSQQGQRQHSLCTEGCVRGSEGKNVWKNLFT